MSRETQQLIDSLYEQLETKDQLIKSLMNEIASLRAELARFTEQSAKQTSQMEGLQELLDNFSRKLFGTSSEKSGSAGSPNENADPLSDGSADPGEDDTEGKSIHVAAHERSRKGSAKKKSQLEELFKNAEIDERRIPADEETRKCPECGSLMNHLGWIYSHHEVRIEPAKMIIIKYYKEKLVCPECRKKDLAVIVEGSAPQALFPHSYASASLVSYIMVSRFSTCLPFYRQEQVWKWQGLPLPRETMAHWCIMAVSEYLGYIYTDLREHLLKRKYLHADETTCQVLREDGKQARTKSYIWIYRTTQGDELPPVVMYDYEPGRNGDYARSFLDGFSGYLHCDGFQGYLKVTDAKLAICLAHCRRYFYEAIPARRRSKLKLCDVFSESFPEESGQEQAGGDLQISSAENGFHYCNLLFMKEREYRDMKAEERKSARLSGETGIWDEFWNWIDSLEPAKGSSFDKAVNYAKNHRDQLMTYLEDGHLAISNNAAERAAKSYVMTRKNSLFHTSMDGAVAAGIIMSLTETAIANGLNPFQYLYTLLIYLPDYKDEPAGREKLLPWSEEMQKMCSGPSDVENLNLENKRKLI